MAITAAEEFFFAILGLVHSWGEILSDRRYGLNQPLTDSRNMRKPTRITVLR